MANHHSQFFKCLIIILIFGISFSKLSAVGFKPDSAKSYEVSNGLNMIVVFSGGGVIGASAKDFFEQYTSFIQKDMLYGGQKPVFVTKPAMYVAIKFDISKKLRAGVSIGRFTSEFNEDIVQEVYTVGRSFLGTRSTIEKISIESIPIIASVEYVPYREQFRSYTGIGAGIVGGKIFWNELVNPYGLQDLRKSSVVFNENVVSPAFRIYTGLELGFDKHPDDYFLGSLIFEVAYTYSFRDAKMLNSLKDQMKPLILKDWSNSYRMAPGFLGMNLAISFNLNKNTFRKRAV